MKIVNEMKIKYSEQQHVGPTNQGKNIGRLLRRKKVAIAKITKMELLLNLTCLINFVESFPCRIPFILHQLNPRGL